MPILDALFLNGRAWLRCYEVRHKRTVIVCKAPVAVFTNAEATRLTVDHPRPDDGGAPSQGRGRNKPLVDEGAAEVLSLLLPCRHRSVETTGFRGVDTEQPLRPRLAPRPSDQIAFSAEPGLRDPI